MSPSAPRPNLAPIAAIVSLLVLALGVTGLFALNLTNAKSAAAIARLETLDQTRLAAVEARAAFKTQVQEWKNILLRGRDAADLATYRARFEKEEATVRADLETLHEHLGEGRVANFSTPTKDALASLDLPALLAEHARLGEAYRAALAGFAPDDPDAPRRTDAAVRGIDRRLSEQLDAFAATVEQAAAAELRAYAANAAGRYEGLRRITWMVAGLTMFASLWLCFRASRVGS
jgi:methyl-accepting chemotaxis protein